MVHAPAILHDSAAHSYSPFPHAFGLILSFFLLILADQEAYEPCDEHSSIHVVISIVRKSSAVKRAIVDKLLQRCHDMYKFFQDYVHPTMHDCEDYIGCPAEEVDIILNGMSSNDNMATRKRVDLGRLRDKLNKLETEQPDCAIAILCSSEDGLFTNAVGIQEYFREFRMLDIVFVVLKGHRQWNEYRLRDVLKAIEDVGNGHAGDTPSHHLVRDWVQISMQKEK